MRGFTPYEARAVVSNMVHSVRVSGSGLVVRAGVLGATNERPDGVVMCDVCCSGVAWSSMDAFRYQQALQNCPLDAQCEYTSLHNGPNHLFCCLWSSLQTEQILNAVCGGSAFE